MAPRVRGRDGSAWQPSSSGNPAHLAGQIMWLPPKDQISVSTNFDDACYHHPIVVLSPTPVHENVVILMATSLNETDLLEKYPHATEVRAGYLPIKPSKCHPDLRIRLEIRGGHKLRKNTYVRTKKQHTLPFKALRVYERERPTLRFTLTPSSYQTLIERAGYSAPVDSPLGTLRLAIPPPPGDPPITSAGPLVDLAHPTYASVAVQPRPQHLPSVVPRRTNMARLLPPLPPPPPPPPPPQTTPPRPTAAESDREHLLRYYRSASTTPLPVSHSHNPYSGYGTLPVSGYRAPARTLHQHLPLPTPHTSLNSHSRNRHNDNSSGGPIPKWFLPCLILAAFGGAYWYLQPNRGVFLLFRGLQALGNLMLGPYAG